jgi:hypothetical protein
MRGMRVIRPRGGDARSAAVIGCGESGSHLRGSASISDGPNRSQIACTAAATGSSGSARGRTVTGYAFGGARKISIDRMAETPERAFRSRSVGPRPRRSRLAVRPHRGAARSHPNHRHVSRGRLVFARLVDPDRPNAPNPPSTGVGAFGRLRATEGGIRCDSQRYVARYCRRYLARCGSARCRWRDPWTHHHGVSGGDRETERMPLGGAGGDDAGVVCAR